METIFFEKQEGMLCAQHALNMLLQQEMFSAVDLSEIAQQLDKEENKMLEEKSSKSQNMDDSGFFSVQVIVKALEPFAIELIHIDNPSVTEIKADPTKAPAFICNMHEHWFTLRKFGDRQWFCLNSVKNGPEVLTDTYLSVYISQLSLDGYSIFVVNGVLPDCTADHVIAANPVALPKREEKKSENSEKPEFKPMTGASQRLGSKNDNIEANAYQIGSNRDMDAEDKELQLALMLSLQEDGGQASTSAAVPLAPPTLSDAADARNKRDLSRFL